MSPLSTTRFTSFVTSPMVHLHEGCAGGCATSSPSIVIHMPSISDSVLPRPAQIGQRRPSFGDSIHTRLVADVTRPTSFAVKNAARSEEHTSELQSRLHL